MHWLRGEKESDRKRCPHADVQFCPLYHAAHVPTDGLHCIDDQLNGSNGCAVDRGRMNYQQVYIALAINHPKLVAECEWLEAKLVSRAQRDRNMRLNGTH